jgi:hypothetical protein
MKKNMPILGVIFFAWAMASAQTGNVTFQVDMRVQVLKGYFNPGTDVVTIPGGFNNWLNEPPANSEKTMDDSDNDTIYTKVITLNAGETYEYKYNIGLGWDGKDELQGQSNRSLIAPTSDSVLAPVFFNNEEMPSGDPVNVTFEVDMRLPAKQNPDFSSRKVYVAGDFTNWGDGAIEMTDADSDSIFNVTTQINSGQLIHYKFIHSTGAASAGAWESDFDTPSHNRETFIVDGDQTISVFWEDDDPNVTLVDGNILFQTDISVLEEIGLFNSTTDSVQARGAFNGWSDSDPSKSNMNQDFLNASEWFLDVPFIQTAVNTEGAYKFRLQVADQDGVLGGDAGYERPLSQGGGNRDYIFEGLNNQQIPTVYFNDVLPDYVIETGQNLAITFQVDMTKATDPLLQAVPFVPGTDRVFLQPGQAMFATTQGWTEGQDTVLELTDANTDMVYEGTLNIQAPSFNGFVYNYQFVNSSGIVSEPSGFGDFAWRVRFIGQTDYREFVQPYSAPIDTWTNQENKSAESEAYPPGYPLSVGGLTGVPYTYSLEQNYPNPFNPSTTIRFTIPVSGMVNMTVYSLLGEKVEEIMNRDMNAGSYEVTFDASKLASGIYFYTIQSGSFTLSKKMILLK